MVHKKEHNLIPDHLWKRVSKGWYGFNIPEEQELIDIILEFDEKIKILIPDYKIHQIKEKFWTLRIYIAKSDKYTPLEWSDDELELISCYEDKGTDFLQGYYKEVIKPQLDEGC